MANVVELIKKDNLAIIQIVNPPRNVLASNVLFKLKECLEDVRQDGNIHNVVLTGKGLFSTGASVEEIYKLAQMGDPAKVQALLTQANDIVNMIENLAKGKLVVAAIERFCLGGGNEIAMACNYRIATESAMFGQPEIKLGIIPGMGGTQRLPRLVGADKALPLLLAGGMITAAEAKELGLVTEVVPDDQLAKCVKEFVKTACVKTIACKQFSDETIFESDSIKGVIENSKFPDACRMIVQAVRDGMKMELNDALALEQNLFAKLVITDKARGGLEAFLGIKKADSASSLQKEAQKPEVKDEDSNNEDDIAEMIQMIRESIQKFAARHLTDANIEKMEEEKRVSPEIIKEMAQSGFFEIPFTLGKTGYCVLLEEISRKHGSLATVVGAHLGLSCVPIHLFGTEDQKAKYLKAGMEGKMLGAFALTEPNAGSDAFSLSTTAEKKNGKWVLNGNKQFITNGNIADFIIVFAQTNKDLKNDGIAAFIVERNWKGVSVGEPEKKMGLHASQTVSITLEDVEVLNENLLGKVGQGYKIAMITLNGGRLSLAAGCLGTAKEAFELAFNYASQRQQFKKLLLEQQIIQQYFAEMRAKIHMMEVGIYAAAKKADQGKDFRMEAAVLKLMCSEMAEEVIDTALQIFGGYGYIREYKVERMLRDARINRIFEGTNEIQKLDIFKNIFKDGGKINPLI
ncbi:MAG: acyl-CoA dehydrogenase family protein [Patescibacteria group bacterium]